MKALKAPRTFISHMQFLPHHKQEEHWKKTQKAVTTDGQRLVSLPIVRWGRRRLKYLSVLILEISPPKGTFPFIWSINSHKKDVVKLWLLDEQKGEGRRRK